jgi:mTERF domain-containing protein
MTPAPALEHVLLSPPVAEDAVVVLQEADVPQKNLRRAAGMCLELISMSVETITATLRFLTEEARLPAEELPRMLCRISPPTPATCGPRWSTS